TVALARQAEPHTNREKWDLKPKADCEKTIAWVDEMIELCDRLKSEIATNGYLQKSSLEEYLTRIDRPNLLLAVVSCSARVWQAHPSGQDQERATAMERLAMATQITSHQVDLYETRTAAQRNLELASELAIIPILPGKELNVIAALKDKCARNLYRAL